MLQIENYLPRGCSYTHSHSGTRSQISIFFIRFPFLPSMNWPSTRRMMKIRNIDSSLWCVISAETHWLLSAFWTLTSACSSVPVCVTHHHTHLHSNHFLSGTSATTCSMLTLTRNFISFSHLSTTHLNFPFHRSDNVNGCCWCFCVANVHK